LYHANQRAEEARKGMEGGAAGAVAPGGGIPPPAANFGMSGTPPPMLPPAAASGGTAASVAYNFTARMAGINVNSSPSLAWEHLLLIFLLLKMMPIKAYLQSTFPYIRYTYQSKG